MSLSRKHFQALADIIRGEHEKLLPHDRSGIANLSEYLRGRVDMLNQTTEALAYFCASHNPNFDRARFLAACKPSTPKE